MRAGFKLRNSTAVVALVVGMAVAVPSPAHAGFFKALVGGVAGFFTGGPAGAVAGAASGFLSGDGGSGGGGGMRLCSAAEAVAIAQAMTSNPAVEAGVKAAEAVGDKTAGAGCPTIEDTPLAMQKLTAEQRDELIEQGEELVRMNAPTTADLSGDIVGGVLAGGDQAKAVGLEWGADAADARFAEQHPETFEGMMPEQMASHSAMQSKEARDAARTSKRTTSAAVTDLIDNIPTEVDTLNAALRDCEGVNCSIGVMAQMIGVSIKVGVLGLAMDAAHYRANESMTDVIFNAREQALQDQRLNNGIVGGSPILDAPDPVPEPIPDEPEPVFDPSVPVS